MSEPHKSKTVLGPDCRISGELALDNDAVIMGHFKGMLRVSGTLELTDSSEVAGTLVVGNLRLAGRVEADVVAEGAVELLGGAHLVGQLFTGRLNIVEGAVFQGDVCVGPHAMQAASEALDADPLPTTQEAPELEAAAETDTATSTKEPTGDSDEANSVKTVSQSVNKVLQRRRPKVLSPRQTTVPSSGNDSP